MGSNEITGRGTRLFLRTDVGKREWVDFVKGTAIILIVAYHTTLFLTSIGFDAAGIGRVKVVLELFPMPAFFLITGVFHNRVGTWSFADVWKRRLRQYLYLYVLWSVIRFVFYLVAPNVRSDGAGTTASDPLALLGILIWPISSYWFIYALFVFTLVLWLFRKAPPWVLLSIALVLSVLSSSGILDARNVGINRMTEYLIFFTLGAYFNRRIFAAVDGMRPWKAAAVTAGFVAFAGLVTLVPVLHRIPGTAFVGQLLAIATGFALAYYLVHLVFLKWVVYVGLRTLNIYLVHVFVIALVVAPLTFLPALDELPGRGLMLIGVLTAIVIVVSILITRYLTRVSWLFVYPFTGRRTRRGQKVETS
ncbi:acyltransferase family protein [Microbacterium sp. 4R-513]|uniref:acyltransferase family protein n=1 Tax=Microbacterium sp. 4R-513 TaxID=2567934 RepID=UPI0013E13D45|nr:acyltransferase family protein [Microbacterium sp. 4R-513]QIG38553.1 acyltransferase family protein [Microbacterium sp. 4R-513]